MCSQTHSWRSRLSMRVVWKAGTGRALQSHHPRTQARVQGSKEVSSYHIRRNKLMQQYKPYTHPFFSFALCFSLVFTLLAPMGALAQDSKTQKVEQDNRVHK